MMNSTGTQTERRYSEPEALKVLGMKNRLTLLRWRKAKKIGYYRIGGRVFYGQKHIDEFIQKSERLAKK